MGLSTIRHGERSRLNAPCPALALQQTEGIASLLASDPETAAHMQDARQMIETGIAARAAERVQDNDIVALAGLIRAQKAATDGAAFTAADIRFHLRVAQICGNPVITAALETLIRMSQGPDLSPEAARRSLREHKRIVGALARSDSVLMAERMEAHLAPDLVSPPR